MKRVIVFLALGPIPVAVAAWLALPVGIRQDPGLGPRVAIAYVLCMLTVSGLAGILDGCLAPSISILRRALLTAAAGAIFTDTLASLLVGRMPPLTLIFPAFAGAAYAGVCALLANDWAAAPAKRIDARN